MMVEVDLVVVFLSVFEVVVFMVLFVVVLDEEAAVVAL